MTRLIILIVLLMSCSAQAGDWPVGLVQKAYDGCMKSGGKMQCECLVARLQYKFTFDDMRLAMNKPIAKIALQQAIETYSMKCLEEDFKKETHMLSQQ